MVMGYIYIYVYSIYICYSGDLTCTTGDLTKQNGGITGIFKGYSPSSLNVDIFRENPRTSAGRISQMMFPARPAAIGPFSHQRAWGSPMTSWKPPWLGFHFCSLWCSICCIPSFYGNSSHFFPYFLQDVGISYTFLWWSPARFPTRHPAEVDGCSLNPNRRPDRRTDRRSEDPSC